jgi:DNA-binding CsgD family transcriptional regulator
MIQACDNSSIQFGIASTAGRAVFKSAVPSKAESVVITYVVAGLSNKEIAGITGKSEGTIKSQVSSILRKNNVVSRSRFIAQYYQRLLARDGGGPVAPR